jgi:acyl-CoA reductase-like NAD-dependent aldehyde dehydrogenase
VHEEVLEPFTQAFVDYASELRVGDGMDPATTMGPLANARRVTAVRDLVRDARDRGARVIEAAPVPDGGGGYYAPAVVLSDLAPGTRLLTEEPFGPVAPILPVSSIELALHEANSTSYGLAAYLFTDSASVVQACERGLEVGALAINTVAVSVPEAPFGGVKDSGLGRESGIEGMEAFLEPRFVHQAHLPS